MEHLKRLFIFLCGCAFVLFILNLIIDNPYTHRIIRNVAHKQINENSNLHLDFASVRVGLTPPEIEIYGVELSSGTDKRHYQFFRASRLTSTFSLWSLLSGDLHIQLLDIDTPDLTWPPKIPVSFQTQEFGTTDSKKSGELLPFLKRVQLTNGKVEFWHPNGARPPLRQDEFLVGSGNINAHVKLEDWNSIDFEIRSSDVNAEDSANSLMESGKVLLSGIYRNQQISANKIEVTSERSNLLGSLNVQWSELAESPVVTGQFGVNGNLSVLGSYLDIENTRGQVSGAIALKYDPASAKNLQIGIDAKINSGMLYGYDLMDSKAKIRIQEDGLFFDEIDIGSDLTRYARSSGKLLFDNQISYDFDIQPEQLSFTTLMDIIGVDFDIFDFYFTQGNVSISGSGKPFNLLISGSPTVDRIATKFLSKSIGDRRQSPECLVPARVEINTQEIKFNSINVLCPYAEELNKSEIEFSGAINLKESSSKMFLSINETELKTFNYMFPYSLGGVLNGNLEIGGPFTATKIETDFTISEPQFSQILAQEMKARISLLNDKLQWQLASIDFGQKGQIASRKGIYDLTDNRLDVQLEPSSINQEVIAKILKIADIGTGLSSFNLDLLKGHASINFAQLNQSTAETTMHVSDIYFLEEPFLRKVSIESSLTKEALTIAEALASTPTFGIELSGELSRNNLKERMSSCADFIACSGFNKKTSILKSSFRVRHQKRGVGDDLKHIPYVGGLFAELGFAGKLAGRGRFSGPLGNIISGASIDVKNLTKNGTSIAPIKFDIFANGPKVDVNLSHGGQSLKGRFSCDLSQNSIPYTWFFSTKQWNLSFLLPTAISSDPRNYLYIDSSWEMRGQLKDWWRSSGRLKVDQVRALYTAEDDLGPNKFIVKNESPIEIYMKPNQWGLEGEQNFVLDGSFGKYQIQVEPSDIPNDIDLSFQGRFEMKSLEGLSQQIESSSGQLLLIGKIAGGLASPDIELNVVTPPDQKGLVSLGLTSARPAFQEINVSAVINNKSVNLQELSARKGGGRVQAIGELYYDNSNQSIVNIKLSEAEMIFDLPVLKRMETALNGDVYIAGNSLPLKVGGNIEVTTARTLQNIDIRNEIIAAIRENSRRSLEEKNKPILEFDLQINAAKSINISNRNLQVQLSSDLTLTGDNTLPVISGIVEIDRGKFIYRREFEFTRGIIVFDDPLKADPQLDILAQAEVSTYRVQIAISGRATNPQVEFSVDPPNREDGTPITPFDILVLLSRGRLPNANNNGLADQEGTVGTEAINVVIGQFEQPLEKLFNLSGQSIVQAPYFETQSQEEGPPLLRANFPVKVVDDLDLIFSWDSAETTVTGKYPLYENISLDFSRSQVNDTNTVQDDKNFDGSLDVRFRFSFP